MRFGSVCSGIEAASVAFGPLGWEAAWFSEIEPFPCGVLAHHFPGVPNLGDMNALPEMILSGAAEAPDMLCGGTPCQAFSFAGKRQSLDDERGNLSLTFCEVADAIDAVRNKHGRDAVVVFWENVPGVLSTKDNAFGCFLGRLVGADTPLSPGAGRWPSAGVVAGPKRKAAWRVLDAQHFGVPQRRRRVFVIASSREGFDPSEVLFERKDVCGNPAPRRTAGQGSSSYAESSFGAFRESDGLSGTPKASGGVLGGGSETVIVEPSVYDMTHANDVVRESKEVPTLQARMGTGGNQIPLVLDRHIEPKVMSVSENQRGEVVLSDRMRSLTSPGGKPGQGNPVVLEPKSPCYCLNDHGGRRIGVGRDLASTLRAETHGHEQAALSGARVRRLTPVECERLQGFPDNWTRIPWRGKAEVNCTDAPRYKAIGNSWAVPCVRWIGERIKEKLNKQENQENAKDYHR